MDHLQIQNKCVDYVRDMDHDGPVLAQFAVFDDSDEEGKDFYVTVAKEPSGYRILHRETDDYVKAREHMVDYFQSLMRNYTVNNLITIEPEYDAAGDEFYA